MNIKTYRFAITGDGAPYDVIVGALNEEGAEVEVHRIIPTTATAALVSATQGTVNDFVGERTLNRVVMKGMNYVKVKRENKARYAGVAVRGHGTG